MFQKRRWQKSTCKVVKSSEFIRAAKHGWHGGDITPSVLLLLILLLREGGLFNGPAKALFVVAYYYYCYLHFVERERSDW